MTDTPLTRKVKTFYCRKCGAMVEPPTKDFYAADFENKNTNVNVSAVIFHCPNEKCDYLHILHFEANAAYRVKLIDAKPKNS